ncbi:MAG TPA: response regulator [Polyangiaceae bacterium]|nr:response regulator [Polyangiaceae bacterium]
MVEGADLPHTVAAPTLLVVEDDQWLRERLVRAFQDRGLAAHGAASVSEALALSEDAPELAVIDLRVGDESGLDVLRALIQKDPATRVVMLTGYGSIATAVEAIRLGAVHYLTKPADADQILAALSRGSGGESVPLGTEPLTLARAEWEHINHVLVSVSGNISEAARRLGLHRRSLQRKLAKYPPAR